MKVLVIANNVFSKTENSGKTLCSFFANFASEDLAQLYFSVNGNESPYEEFCNNYYKITEVDILNAKRNHIPVTTNAHKQHIENINNTTSRLPWYYRKIYKKRYKLIRELIWRSDSWDSPDLKKWVEEFKPDAIFAVLGSNLYVHKIAIRLSERYNIPMFIYFTDDYYVDSTVRGVLSLMHRRLLRKQYKISIAKAHRAYVIGEKMQRDYSQVFGKPFGILGNGIDVEKYLHLAPKKIEKRDTLIISYIGALHSNRWKTIAALGEIVKEINQKLDGNKLAIRVFSPIALRTKMKKAFAAAEIEFCGPLDSAGVVKQMEQSHFLLHVESFDRKNRAFVRYSISTKISEYLSSNRMILAYGPHEVASMQLLMENGFGCCLTDLNTKEDMVCKICEAIESYNNYDYASSKQFVLENYTKEIMTSRLETDLAKAINENHK